MVTALSRTGAWDERSSGAAPLARRPAGAEAERPAAAAS